MPGTHVDANAQQGGRVRRNWSFLNKGGSTATLNVSPPLTVTGTNQLALQLLTAGGLAVSGASLGVVLDTNPGLSLSATGLKITLATGAPLTLAGGLDVATDGVTIEINAAALRLKDGGVTAAKLAIPTAKGDLLGFSTLPARVPYNGTNNQLLMTDTSQATGLKWASRRVGNVTLVAGTITVNDASVTTSTIILYCIKTASGTVGSLTTSRAAGVSFTITSTSIIDTSVISYELVEP